MINLQGHFDFAKKLFYLTSSSALFTIFDSQVHLAICKKSIPPTNDKIFQMNGQIFLCSTKSSALGLLIENTNKKNQSFFFFLVVYAHQSFKHCLYSSCFKDKAKFIAVINYEKSSHQQSSINETLAEGSFTYLTFYFEVIIGSQEVAN